MNNQGGFTLIELIMVIVILGILAAFGLASKSNQAAVEAATSLVYAQKCSSR